MFARSCKHAINQTTTDDRVDSCNVFCASAHDSVHGVTNLQNWFRLLL